MNGEREWGRSIRDPDRLAGSRFVDELQVADVTDLAKALLPSGAAVVRRWCTRRLLPQPAVPQDSFDHVVLRWLDEADDLEASVAARTFKRIDVPDPFDQRCPAPAGTVGPRRAVVVDLHDVALVGVGFGAEAAGFTGIPAEITSQVPSGVGDVLGELGDEVQGIKDLEVTGNVPQEVTACGLGEASRGFLLGQVQDLAFVGDADHAIQAEGASEHVLRQAFTSGEVVGAEPDRKVHSEAGVLAGVWGR